MTHVFVVSQATFSYHLQYMFAGTGAKDKVSQFLADPTVSYNFSAERMIVGMIADISRIRQGDNIIFYLQASDSLPGRFFGVFEAASSPFWDAGDEENYLLDELGKRLEFRVLIRPKEVYARGITEHDYLDSLAGKTHPSDLCWSLIYRKLKGNRGCTMITDFEFEDLLAKLRSANRNQVVNGNGFSYDRETECIVASDAQHTYEGRRNSLNILPRLLDRASSKKAFEVHLQTYIAQHFDAELSHLLMPFPDQKCWFGNEVACGVGMQRIDVLLAQENQTDVYIRLVELKQCEPYLDIIAYQIPRYIDWLSDYIVPKYRGKNVHIIPTVLAKGDIPETLSDSYANFAYPMANADVQPLQYIGFRIANGAINFQRHL